MAEEEFHKRHTIPGTHPNGHAPLEEIPATIGPYKIEGLLERGGMSLLYLGTHPDTKEPTAIKVLSPKFMANPEIIQRFIDEAGIISMTDHPNIVRLYGQGQWEGGLYIAMEFVEGISLRQLLLRHPLSLKQSLDIILDVAYALCHLHTHGVIHRDLKPENILLTEDNIIKVIDFGIAQLLTQEGKDPQKERHRLIGTPIYMSPEQQETPEAVSYASDVYSLGIIAYELILGKLSHGRIHLSLLPKGMQKILSRALQPKPEDRYQDVVDFIGDISGYIHSPSFKQDALPSDQLSLLSETLKMAQQSLLPASPPSWQGVDIHTALYRDTRPCGLYYDFFTFPDDRALILTIEAKEKSVMGVINVAMVRGMVKLLAAQQAPPEEWLSLLNERLLLEGVDRQFAVNWLLFDFKTSTFSYAGCGRNLLWHLKKKGQEVTSIPTSNPLLGALATFTCTPINQEWEPDDLLLLSSIVESGEETHLSLEAINRIIFQELEEQKEDLSPLLASPLLRKIKTRPNKTLLLPNILLIGLKFSGNILK